MILIFVCGMWSLGVHAETKDTRSAQKHEVRIGYGDPMYETMRWRDEPNKLGVPMNARQNYRYTGHIYGEHTCVRTPQAAYLTRWLRYPGKSPDTQYALFTVRTTRVSNPV